MKQRLEAILLQLEKASLEFRENTQSAEEIEDAIEHLRNAIEALEK